MTGMDENLPIHLGDVSIKDIFKETPFEDLGGQIRLQYRTCMKDIFKLTRTFVVVLSGLKTAWRVK